MGIFTQWLSTVNIAGKMYANLYAPDAGFGLSGFALNGGANTTKRAETLQEFPIRAGSSTIRFYFEGAQLNWGTSAGMSDLQTSVSVQRMVGGEESGPYETLLTDQAVVKGLSYLSPAYVRTVSSGEGLNIDCWVSAVESGKYISGTQQQRLPRLGAVGNTLTFSGDGSVATPLNTEIAFCPGLILGKTRARGLALMGHSRTTAIHNFGQSGTGIAADTLGVAFGSAGLGGSLLSAWLSTANWDLGLYMGRTMVILGMINAINNFAANTNPDVLAITTTAIPTGTGTGFTTSMADQLRYVLRRYKALGLKCYVLTESYPGGSNTARQLECWHYWNEWLVGGGAAAYYGALLDGVIDSRPYFADTPYIDGVPLSPTDAGGRSSTDIHANYDEEGEAVAAYFGSGGAGESALVADENSLVETFSELFHGAQTTPGAGGALPSGWVEWFHSSEAARLGLNGTGALRVVSPTTRNTYAICTTALGGSDDNKTFVVRAFSAPWVAQVDGQGLGIYLHSTPSSTSDNSTHAAGTAREGYYLRFSNTGTQLNVNRLRYNSVNDQSTYSIASSSISNVTGYAGQAMAAGDILSVEVTRTFDPGTGNNTFDVLVYKNGILLTVTSGLSTWTDTVTTPPYQGNLYLGIGTTGNTITTHTSGSATWDAVQAANYDATVISTVSGPTTVYVPRGGSEPVEVLVMQSAPTVGAAVGVTVTASVSGLAGATVGAAATTGVDGVGRFSDGAALTIPDSLPVGATGTITFVCIGISETVNIEVIESSGAGSGSASVPILGGRIL